MFISSLNTKKAKQELEKIKGSGSESGKTLLKDFLNRELKILSTKSNSKMVIIKSKIARSNIYKFANLLKDEKNMQFFKTAIEKQAKSLGTKKSGLFNKLIYPIRNDWMNSKAQIKAFLLAHNDKDISSDESKYIEQNIEADLDDGLKKLRRMGKNNIVDKLNSNRLSDILKVFMALVMWNYIIIKENESKNQEDLKNPELIWVDDKEYFYDENDINKYKLQDKHIIRTVKDDPKIFPKGKPLPSEVRQSYVGDCYLMAALIALAKTNPKAITDCFVQGLDKIEKEDKINIRFFYTTDKVNIDESAKLEEVCPVIITINKNKVIEPEMIKDGALWPSLIEKAYAIYRKEGYSIENCDALALRKKLDGGQPISALFAITGAKKLNAYCPMLTSRYRRKEKLEPEKIIDTIRKELKKSRTLTCTFKKEFIIKDVKSQEKIEIFDHHVYAIVGINDAKKYIRLINPWKIGGYGGRKAENSPKSQEGGHIAMSFDDFKKNYNTISYITEK